MKFKWKKNKKTPAPAPAPPMPPCQQVITITHLPGETEADESETVTTCDGFTLQQKIPGRAILNLSTAWKFSLWVASGTFTADHSVILRTAIDSLAVVDSTTVLWSGVAGASLAVGENFCDAIALTLDSAHDYWIFVHGTSSANLKVSTTVPTQLLGSGYVSGDQTGVTTVFPSATEIALSRVVSA
jgi:hypothetical protein